MTTAIHDPDARADGQDQDDDTARLQQLLQPGYVQRRQRAVEAELAALDERHAALAARTEGLAAAVTASRDAAPGRILATGRDVDAAGRAGQLEEVAAMRAALAQLGEQRATIAQRLAVARAADDTEHWLLLDREIARRTRAVRALFRPVCDFEGFPPDYTAPPLTMGRTAGLLDFAGMLRRGLEFSSAQAGISLGDVREAVARELAADDEGGQDER